LYEETKSQLNEIKPKYDEFVSFESSETEKMLLDFPEEEREAFKGMTYQQMKVIHSKLINKKPNVPSVDNSNPVDNAHGYSSGNNGLLDAARDFQKGKISESIFNKVKIAFRQNQ